MMANTLGLEGFSRIDAFVNVRSGEVPPSLIFVLCFKEDICAVKKKLYYVVTNQYSYICF
jgi:hypothetical protein